MHLLKTLLHRFEISVELAKFLGCAAALRILAYRSIRYQNDIPVKLSGLRGPIWLRPAASDLWMLKQVFFDDEYSLALHFSLQHILDLGGNCGFSALYLAHHFPYATIYTVEPDPENFALLQKNVVDYPNIHPIHAAVWDKNGLVFIVDSTRDASERSFAEAESNQSESIGVEAFTIRALTEKLGVERWDFIKMDIEGAELRLLSSADSWIDLAQLIGIEIHAVCHEQAEALLERATASWPFREKRDETYWRARKNPHTKSCIMGKISPS